MSFRIWRNVARSSVAMTTRPRQHYTKSRVTRATIARNYVSDSSGAVPGQSSNASSPQASSSEAQSVNKDRATDSLPGSSPDSASLAKPVTDPEESGIGGQEEQTESQDQMKRDPNESDSKKREKVLEYGQNKKLDAADN
ncbi:hypothetical protein BDV95DRAFT_381085 [Massariosphaeria phaeospora]|uniref:Uncharacterized protein n=1 Tax=Massariosphaeria phaeospora TaxID=100035 RepID=A0A7C8I753_9PLEO|nr:hypothetical protein BDV95DRAFT_381085 [Massariosphaeria phaeospora]